MTPNHFFRRTLLVAACLLTLSAGVFADPHFTISDKPHFTISDKLLETFRKTFPDAMQVKWVEQPDSYMVTFKQNDILTKVNYDKDGNFVSSIRYYSEKNLPVTIICRLEKEYAGKSVFGVTEVATQNGTEYYIKLQDDKNWYTVHSDSSGNLERIEKFRKA
jgi:hypothetical protein